MKLSTRSMDDEGSALRKLVADYFIEKNLTFQKKISSELSKASLFFSGQFFAFSLMLLMLNFLMVGVETNKFLILSGISLFLAMLCVIVFLQPTPKLVSLDEQVSESLLNSIYQSDLIHKRVKKHIAVSLKRNSRVTYKQVLAFDDASNNITPRMIGSQVKESYISSLDKGLFN